MNWLHPVFASTSRPGSGFSWAGPIIAVWISVLSGCADQSSGDYTPATADLSRTAAEIGAAVEAFHAADTARDAEAVIALLWPDFTMMADGVRRGYDDVASGTREFMAGLEFFHTEWTDLQIVPLGADAAVASFQFRDSIMSTAGDLIRNRGPTTFVWERRNGQWRIRFADADHYPIDR